MRNNHLAPVREDSDVVDGAPLVREDSVVVAGSFFASHAVIPQTSESVLASTDQDASSSAQATAAGATNGSEINSAKDLAALGLLAAPTEPLVAQGSASDKQKKIEKRMVPG